MSTWLCDKHYVVRGREKCTALPCAWPSGGQRMAISNTLHQIQFGLHKAKETKGVCCFMQRFPLCFFMNIFMHKYHMRFLSRSFHVCFYTVAAPVANASPQRPEDSVTRSRHLRFTEPCQKALPIFQRLFNCLD